MKDICTAIFPPNEWPTKTSTVSGIRFVRYSAYSFGFILFSGSSDFPKPGRSIEILLKFFEIKLKSLLDLPHPCRKHIVGLSEFTSANVLPSLSNCKAIKLTPLQML